MFYCYTIANLKRPSPSEILVLVEREDAAESGFVAVFQVLHQDYYVC